MGLNQSRGILKEIMLDVPSFLSRKEVRFICREQWKGVRLAACGVEGSLERLLCRVKWGLKKEFIRSITKLQWDQRTRARITCD